MLGGDDLTRIREEREVLENWRAHSRHVVADLLEACTVCGCVRDKDRLTRCRWCEERLLLQRGRLRPAAPRRHPPLRRLLDLVGSLFCPPRVQLWSAKGCPFSYTYSLDLLRPNRHPRDASSSR